MFKNILAPIDLSGRNARALECASELATQSSGTVTLLHVIETIQDVPFDEIEEFYSGLREKAQQVLAKRAQELMEKKIDVRSEIVFGKRGLEIVGCAEDHNCDVIVLTAHPLDREHPGAKLGSVSHQVAVLASCSVILVR
jgi:nucleotide-binding universal stress UspA family protein